MRGPKCVLCDEPIEDKEEQQWALNNANHPGVLGPCHQRCYDKEREEGPLNPWEDPIRGAMVEDYDVDTGEEDWDEEEFW